MLTVGKALEALRLEGGYRISDVAQNIGMAGATYSKVERDQREGSFIMIYRICTFYGISMQEFADMLSPAELGRSDLSSIRAMEQRKKNFLKIFDTVSSGDNGP